MENIKSILESLLFISDEPLTIDRLKNILAPVTAAEIRSVLNNLIREYEERRGGFLLKEVAGGYQFRTRSEHSEWITKLIQPRPPRLSKAALETLAIIAYKQPLIRSDIEHIRGVDCGGVIRVLLERNLVRVLGRKEIPGRPLIYATTKRFLEVFDLKDLKDLPTPKEIDEMGQALADRSNIVMEDDRPKDLFADADIEKIDIQEQTEASGPSDGDDESVKVPSPTPNVEIEDNEKDNRNTDDMPMSSPNSIT
jgi:segregation and condensation protein B